MRGGGESTGAANGANSTCECARTPRPGPRPDLPRRQKLRTPISPRAATPAGRPPQQEPAVGEGHGCGQARQPSVEVATSPCAGGASQRRGREPAARSTVAMRLCPSPDPLLGQRGPVSAGPVMCGHKAYVLESLRLRKMQAGRWASVRARWLVATPPRTPKSLTGTWAHPLPRASRRCRAEGDLGKHTVLVETSRRKEFSKLVLPKGRRCVRIQTSVC